MLCVNCAKLVLLNLNKKCIKCQGSVFNNLSILCESCSAKEKQCSVCLKKIQLVSERYRGCNCGK